MATPIQPPSFGSTPAFPAAATAAFPAQPSFGVPHQPAGAVDAGSSISFGFDPNAIPGPNPGASAVFMQTPPGSPLPGGFSLGPGVAPTEFPTSPSFYDYRTNQALRDKRAKIHTPSGGIGLGPQPGTASPSTFQLPQHPSAVPLMPPGLHPPLGIPPHLQFDPNMLAAMAGLSHVTPLVSSPLPPLASSPPRETTVTTKLLLLVALVFKKSLITSEEKGKLKDLVLSNNQLVFSALEVFEIDQDLDELTDTFRRICKFA